MHDDVSVLNRIEYEIAIATGFGLSMLRPVDGILRDYFGRLVSDPPDSGALIDAITLLRLVQAAQPRRGTDISADEAAQWGNDLEQVIEAKLEAAPGPNAKVSLLAAAVILALGPRGFTAEDLSGIDPAAGPTIADVYQELSTRTQEGRHLPRATNNADLRDLDLGMAHLVDLVTPCHQRRWHLCSN